MRNLNLNLFGWCAGVFAVTGLLLLVAWNLWGLSWSWFGGLGEEPIARATSALTTVGGLGGAVFLTVKYRERSSAERNEVTEQLLKAVDQLGHVAPQVRIAGVYALEDLATLAHRQRVVNILCGYLRTQRENDASVESTILNVFRTHLTKCHVANNGDILVEQAVPDGQLWCDCTIDLHGATLTETTNFEDATFTGANFRGTKFTGAYFEGATFTDTANFEGATFSRTAYFGDATFTKTSDFGGAKFTDNAYFGGATFSRTAYFGDAKFTDNAHFWRATFTDTANFEGATFTVVNFEDTSFTVANFEDAKFDITAKQYIVFPTSNAFVLRDGIPEDALWWNSSIHQPATPTNDDAR